MALITFNDEDILEEHLVIDCGDDDSFEEVYSDYIGQPCFRGLNISFNDDDILEEHLVIDCGDIIALRCYTDICRFEEVSNCKFVTL